MLGWWVQIPLKAWMSVFVLSRVKDAALIRADHLSKESYRLCKKDYKTEEEAWALEACIAIDE
jgi:hypothetical protein